MVHVELILVLTENTIVHECVRLQDGATVGDAIAAVQLMKRYPEAASFVVGIFSKKVTLETLLRSGDRVELYRPLILDPKDRRRQRVLKK